MCFYPEVTAKLKTLFQKFRIKFAHRSQNIIKQHFGSLTSDPRPELLKSGIYKITCQAGYAFFYVGETIRNLKVRFGEHIGDWLNDESGELSVAAHLLANGHKIDIDHILIVQEVHKIQFTYVEAIHIHKSKHINLIDRRSR